MRSPMSLYLLIFLRVAYLATRITAFSGTSPTRLNHRRLLFQDTQSLFLFDERSSTSQRGEYIPIADDPEYRLAHEAWESRSRQDSGWLLVLAIPIVTPIVAFLSYDAVAYLFDEAVELLSYARAWISVDGGAFQAKIITPAINGVVLPAIAGRTICLGSTAGPPSPYHLAHLPFIMQCCLRRSLQQQSSH